jgi:hypothetical protein
LLQLASGQNVTGTVSSIFAPVSNMISSANATFMSATQQINTLFNSAKQNVTQTTQNSINTVQQQAAALNLTAAQAQACTTPMVNSVSAAASSASK